MSALKVDMIQQCVLAAQKVNCILGCIRREVIRSKEGCSTLVTPHVEYFVHLWSPLAQERQTLLK